MTGGKIASEYIDKIHAMGINEQCYLELFLKRWFASKVKNNFLHNSCSMDISGD